MRRKKKILPLSSAHREFFQEFYGQFANYIRYTVHCYAGPGTAWEDLYQETLERLMKNAGTLRQLNRAQTAKYIQVTVKAVWLDMERERLREQQLLPEKLAEELRLSQAEETAAAEAVEVLRRELGPRDWAVLEGKYILGLSDTELSELFGIAPDSVRTLLSRSRKRARMLLSKLEKEGDV